MGEKLFDFIKENIKNPKFYFTILLLIVIFFLLFPYVDANFFYYKRMIFRVEILEKVSEIDTEHISDDPILYKEYQDILQKISTQPNYSIDSIFTKEIDHKWNVAKFVSGGLVFWGLALMCLFIKGFDNWGVRIVGFLIFSGIAFLFGYIAKLMPNVFNHYVNCIGFPIIILIMFCTIIFTNEKHKNEKTVSNIDD